MRDPNFRLPFIIPPGEHSIATSGQHFGAVVQEHVFDNIFREGILLADWQAQFDCDVHHFTISKIESF